MCLCMRVRVRVWSGVCVCACLSILLSLWIQAFELIDLFVYIYGNVFMCLWVCVLIHICIDAWIRRDTIYPRICCSVLQCGAVCDSMVHCGAVCCSVLQRISVGCSVLQCVGMGCNRLQCVAVCGSLMHGITYFFKK